MNGTTGAVEETATEVADTAVEETTTTDGETPPASAPAPSRRGTGGSRLEEEGDIAADYLEELLDIIDLDGDIDIDIENGRASIAVVADEAGTPALSRLVGSGGEVLDALQELTRLAVQASTGDRTRLLLDVAGHRARKRATLVGLADAVVARVRASGEREVLDPMPAFERKVVHDAIAAAGLTSESEGEEPQRRVVVLPVAVDPAPVDPAPVDPAPADVPATGTVTVETAATVDE